MPSPAPHSRRSSVSSTSTAVTDFSTTRTLVDHEQVPPQVLDPNVPRQDVGLAAIDVLQRDLNANSWLSPAGRAQIQCDLQWARQLYSNVWVEPEPRVPISAADRSADDHALIDGRRQEIINRHPSLEGIYSQDAARRLDAELRRERRRAVLDPRRWSDVAEAIRSGEWSTRVSTSEPRRRSVAAMLPSIRQSFTRRRPASGSSAAPGPAPARSSSPPLGRG